MGRAVLKSWLLLLLSVHTDKARITRLKDF